MPKLGARWHRKQEHPQGCTGCARAADNAKTDAIMDGADEATYTYTLGGIDHTVTVTRPSTRSS